MKRVWEKITNNKMIKVRVTCLTAQARQAYDTFENKQY